MAQIIKPILSLLLFFCFTGLCAQDFKDNVFSSKYCYDNGYHSLTVIFKQRGETVYFYYLDILDNGNYLNGFDEEMDSDYAGKFDLSQFKDSAVNFTIKSYRDTDDKYILALSLNKKNGWLYWNINQKGPVAYLPKHASLKRCK
jgi:hypothetical protein